MANYLQISAYGPFHRRASPTQTDAVVEDVLDTGELWGRPPFGSDLPAVKAYVVRFLRDRPDSSSMRVPGRTTMPGHGPIGVVAGMGACVRMRMWRRWLSWCRE
jgi:hypothetical protein